MITVSRAELSAELTLLQSVVSKYATMPILDTVRFEASDKLRLTASSIDVTLTTEIALPGLVNESESWCVPIKPLVRLVSLFEKDEVALEQVENGRVRVQCGRSKHLLPLLPVAEFPEPDAVEAEMITVKGRLLAAILSHTAFAVLPQAGDLRQGDQKFTGLHLTLASGTLTVAATNKLRLAIARTRLTGSDFAVILPQSVIAPLKRFNDDDIQLGVSANGNLMTVRAGSRQLTARLMVDKPLDWSSLFPKSYTHSIEIDSETLSGSLKRVLVTSDDRPSFVVNGLKFTLANDELKIESRDGDYGKSDESLPITCPSLNGEPVYVGVNGPQVVDYLALDIAGEKTKLEITPDIHVFRLSPVTLKEFDYEYLVNTIKLKW
jgi:DNA polymerase sliding clamp subunit (PCNA homolog)